VIGDQIRGDDRLTYKAAVAAALKVEQDLTRVKQNKKKADSETTTTGFKRQKVTSLNWPKHKSKFKFNSGGKSMDVDKTHQGQTDGVIEDSRQGQTDAVVVVTHQGETDDGITHAAQRAEALKAEFTDVFGDMPDGLHPERNVSHDTVVPPNVKPPVRSSYRMSIKDEQEVERQIAELLRKGCVYG
jgi:hypothetical protein